MNWHLCDDTGNSFYSLFLDTGFYPSKSQILRMAKQGAIKVRRDMGESCLRKNGLPDVSGKHWITITIADLAKDPCDYANNTFNRLTIMEGKNTRCMLVGWIVNGKIGYMSEMRGEDGYIKHGLSEEPCKPIPVFHLATPDAMAPAKT